METDWNTSIQIQRSAKIIFLGCMTYLPHPEASHATEEKYFSRSLYSLLCTHKCEFLKKRLRETPLAVIGSQELGFMQHLNEKLFLLSYVFVEEYDVLLM